MPKKKIVVFFDDDKSAWQKIWLSEFYEAQAAFGHDVHQCELKPFYELDPENKKYFIEAMKEMLDGTGGNIDQILIISHGQSGEFDIASGKIPKATPGSVGVNGAKKEYGNVPAGEFCALLQPYLDFENAVPSVGLICCKVLEEKPKSRPRVPGAQLCKSIATTLGVNVLALDADMSLNFNGENPIVQTAGQAVEFFPDGTHNVIKERSSDEEPVPVPSISH